MQALDVQVRVQAAWVEQRWDDWRATCAPGYRFDLLPGVRLDVDQTLEWSRAWFAAFPDYREEVRAVYPRPGGAAYELIGGGSSSADLVLFGRVIAPHLPGRTVEVRYAKVLVLDDEGLVVEDRQYLDPQALRDQLSAA